MPINDGKLSESEAQLIVDHCDEVCQIFADNIERFAQLPAALSSAYIVGQITHWTNGIKALNFARQYAIDKTRK